MPEKRTIPTTVDIIETGHSANVIPSVVVPNTVRINGREVMVPVDCPPVVHKAGGDEPVRVTVTFFAHRVTVGME